MNIRRIAIAAFVTAAAIVVPATDVIAAVRPKFGFK